MNRPSDRELAREAFSRTHAAPAAHLTARVRERLREERRRSDSPRRILGPALAALTCLVLVSALLTAGGAPVPPDGGGEGRASDVSTLSHGPPDTGTTVLVPAVPGPSAPAPVRRLDWNGRTVGWLAPPAGAPSFSVSPDGQLVESPDPDGGVSILDTTGRPVAHVAAWAHWSGDGGHVLCPAKPGDGIPWPVGLGAGWEVWGCSVRADRLVAVRFDHEARQPYALTDVAVISRSDGAVQSHLTYPSHPVVAIPALSADCRYLAEPGPAARWTAIRDLRTGDLVGRVRGTVVAFSGDGSVVLTNGGPDDAPVASIVDWRWGQVVWAGAGQATPIAVRPGGRDFVIAVGSRTLMVWGGGQALDLSPRDTSTLAG